MAKITFIQPDGSEQIVDGEPGMTVMETAKKNLSPASRPNAAGPAPAPPATSMSTTPGARRSGRPSEMEEDMLDFAFDVRPSSRLSCQIKVTEALDGLVLNVPEKQF